jgi:hypothetical protein
MCITVSFLSRTNNHTAYKPYPGYKYIARYLAFVVTRLRGKIYQLDIVLLIINSNQVRYLFVSNERGLMAADVNLR